MMFAATSLEFIPIAVERTLDSLIGGLVLAGVAWTWLRVARRQNSASRFIILFILLIGIAVLPIVGLSWIGQSSQTRASAVHSLVTLPQNAAEYIFLAWGIVAFAGLLRIAVGFWQLRRLKQSCIEIDSTTLDAGVRASLLSSTRPAILCTSDRVNVPTALGLAHPARIVIPSWLMDQLSADELHHLVLHELAHLRRWDDWSNLAQRILGALLFFHPAVWWLQSRLSLEREMACDECVLAQTGNARAYARSLAAVAERSFVRRTVALAQSAVSKLHDTTLRVSKILSPGSRRPASAVPMLASVAVVGGLTVAVALFSPDLVSFSSPAAQVPLTASSDAGAPDSFTSFANEPVQRASVEKEAPLKTVLASMPVRHALKNDLAKNDPKSYSPKPLMASARETEAPETLKAPKVIPAKASLDKKHSAQPAMLIFWQETYDDGNGNIVQRSYWRVVVLQNLPQEQPKRI